jgi:hypothetical protein
MPRAYKGVRFQTGRGRTETGRKGARQSKSGRETKPTVYEARYSRPCPACGRSIDKGARLRKLDGVSVHEDCAKGD